VIDHVARSTTWIPGDAFEFFALLGIAFSMVGVVNTVRV